MGRCRFPIGLAVMLATGLGCARTQEETVWVAPPLASGSLLLVIEDEHTEIYAYALDGQAIAPPVLLDPERARVYAAHYPSPLASLGLVPGAVQPYQGGSVSRRLPASSERWELELSSSEGHWRPLSDEIGALVALPISPEPFGCAHFQHVSSLVVAAMRPFFAVTVEGERAVASIEGQLYLCDRGGGAFPLPTSEPLAATAAYRDADGGLWLAGTEGHIRTASLGNREMLVGPAVTATVAGGYSGFAVTPSNQPFHVFAVFADGRFARFDPGVGWVTLHDYGPQPAYGSSSVLLTSDGRVFASRFNSGTVVVVENGVVQLEVPERGSDVTGLGIDQEGTLLATLTGGDIVARRAANDWIPVFALFDEGGSPAFGVTAYEDSMIALGALGRIRQIRDGRPCASQDFATRSSRVLAPMGPDLLLGLDGDEQNEALFVLRRVE